MATVIHAVTISKSYFIEAIHAKKVSGLRGRDCEI
jgi:hypothetical protein